MSKRFALLLLAVGLIAGCANPKTRGEFKTVVVDHPSLSLHGTHTSARRMNDVLLSVQRKWNECFAGVVETTRVQNGITAMKTRDTYRVDVEKPKETIAELTLLSTTTGAVVINGREGGNFAAALDVERVSPTKTKITWYSAALGWSDGWQRTKEWSDGKNTPCP